MSPTKVQSAATEVCSLIASQTRRGCLCNPPHPRVGGMHPCHLDPLTEIGRGGSGPTSLPVWEHHPGMLQRLCRLSCSTSEGYRVQNSAVGYPVGVSV